jgi:hypothetical protein
MRSIVLSVALTGLLAGAGPLTASAWAQPSTPPAPGYPPASQPPAAGYPQSSAVPAGANPMTGARPGNDIGTGESLPTGTHASNIDQHDTRSPIAPNLPGPSLGPNASPTDYLRSAQSALAAGQTGVAQQALEMAQTRLLDRSVDFGQTDRPSGNPAVDQITQALHALASGHRAQCMQLIQSAIPMTQASAR